MTEERLKEIEACWQASVGQGSFVAYFDDPRQDMGDLIAEVRRLGAELKIWQSEAVSAWQSQ